jgi:hypothetical protein
MADPTLAAVDAAIEAKAKLDKPRPYLGMSAVGNSCKRALWYTLRWSSKSNFDAETLKRFDDGHRGEDVQAARLRLVPQLELATFDIITGKQFACVDLGGHFRGHLDGKIKGLLQAPKTPHVWEHKQVGEKKFDEMTKLKAKHDEKDVLEKWDATYYAQAQLYMHYQKIDRHYLTVATAGGRKTQSVRTEYNQVEAFKIIAKAESIIFSPEPPPRISENPAWFECKWCSHHDVCHSQKVPELSCRTCVHSTPEREGDGVWSCAKYKQAIPTDFQRTGCKEHLPLPYLVPFAEAVDAGETWIMFKRKDTGKVFVVGDPGTLECARESVYTSQELSASKDHRAIGDDQIEQLRAQFQGSTIVG